VDKRKLLLVELNEINFDVVQRYLETDASRFPSLSRLMRLHSIRTEGEAVYEQLEPWIQWPSVHTGLAYDEHRIFRLGDVVNSSAPQFFEQLEELGWRVGAICPMNVENRLRSPAYFLPDPWTNTPSDGSWWSNALAGAVSQSVNDNAESKISLRSMVVLLLGLLRFSRPKHWPLYFRLALRARRAPWCKALFLDLFLHDLHMRRFADKKPDFSAIFLNAGAHIQHHYFFNSVPLRAGLQMANPEWYVSSEADPIGEMLEFYDRLIADYLAIEGVELLVATGLSQRPYEGVKFYYRLRDHAAFLRQLDIEFEGVFPRMTRDFLVDFRDAETARAAEVKLRSVVVDDGAPLFGEISNRGASLFVTLTYPREIVDDTVFRFSGKPVRLAGQVVFVAVKNGMHQSTGYAFFSRGLQGHAPPDGKHVKELRQTIMGFFAGMRVASRTSR